MKAKSSQYSLWSYVLAHRGQVVQGTLLVAASVAITVSAPFITRFAIDALVDGSATWPKIIGYAVLYLGAVALSAIMALGMRKILLSLGHQVEYEVRRDLFARLALLDYYFYSRERTGDLMTKMTSDLNAVREFVGQGILQGARTTIGFLLAFGVMFAINTQLALVMLFLLPATSVLFFLLLSIIRRRYEETQAQFSRISNFCQESFAGIRTVRGYGIEDRYNSLFAGLNEHYIALKMALSRVERPLWPVMGMFFSFGVVLILWVGGRQVIAGQLTVGEFVQFSQYLFILQWPMLALGWTVNLLQRGLGSWDRIRAILDAEPQIKDAPTDGSSTKALSLTTPLTSQEPDAVSFKHVTLCLGGVEVLKGIDLQVPKGQTLGITGPTGSGKTLLAMLIARLLDPTSGQVLVKGCDVREMRLGELRALIGMAPQEAFLFSDTLANNIAFGLEDTNPDIVFAAAELAELHTDVKAFPDQFETLLGERGVTLSGGQRQRAAISRALARDPEILILDDVFSAIDTQTEAAIQARFQSFLTSRTTLIISHRISSLRHANRIIVLQDGRITQAGTHRELIQMPGYYRELDEIQRLQAELEHTP